MLISTLQAVQNFAAWIVTSTRKYDHVTPSLKKLKWLPVLEQLVVRDAVVIFKCMHGLVPQYLCHKFKMRSEFHDRNIRHKNHSNIPLFKSAAGQCTFVFRGQKLWISLPDKIASSNSIVTFKATLRQYFLEEFSNSLSLIFSFNLFIDL